MTLLKNTMGKGQAGVNCQWIVDIIYMQTSRSSLWMEETKDSSKDTWILRETCKQVITYGCIYWLFLNEVLSKQINTMFNTTSKDTIIVLSFLFSHIAIATPCLWKSPWNHRLDGHRVFIPIKKCRRGDFWWIYLIDKLTKQHNNRPVVICQFFSSVVIILCYFKF